MAYPTLNGYSQSWTDIAITVNLYGDLSIDFADIVDISWKRTLEQGEQRNTGGSLVARTGGRASYECTVTFWSSGYWKMVAALGAAAVKTNKTKNGIAELSRVGFDIVVQHTPEGVDRPRMVEILGCQWTEDGSDMAESTDADKMAINPNPRLIVTTDQNGLKSVLKL